MAFRRKHLVVRKHQTTTEIRGSLSTGEEGEEAVVEGAVAKVVMVMIVLEVGRVAREVEVGNCISIRIMPLSSRLLETHHVSDMCRSWACRLRGQAHYTYLLHVTGQEF